MSTTAGVPSAAEVPAANARVAADISILTAGRDRSYARGLASALIAQGVALDIIGSSDVDSPDWHGNPLVRFLDLRDQREDAGLVRKIWRVVVYYVRLMAYAAGTEAKVFHILWNNKFECFDRVLLMLYYRALGKKIVFTAHNVNAGRRDGNDSWLNRITLRIQYGLCDHLLVHTEKMRSEMITEFGIRPGQVSVIPFGINNTVPNTTLTTAEARRQLGIRPGEKTLLFFGNITPYKGLEHLVEAFIGLAKRDASYRLIIVGKPKGCEDYWQRIHQSIAGSGVGERVIQRIEYVPDEQTELFFKAADVPKRRSLPGVQLWSAGHRQRRRIAQGGDSGRSHRPGLPPGGRGRSGRQD
jgi:D-inositol-3-phosphate glycosyltransferase